ncbi:MAG: hypothetical protein ACFFDC_00985 [Promethearchaeota archaeon]
MLCVLSYGVIVFPVKGALVLAAPKPKLNYSWKETTFSKSHLLVWQDDSYSINDSGSFSNVYRMDYYTHNTTGGYYIKEDRIIYTNANFTTNVNVTTSGNSTINFDLDAFQVNLDYDKYVKFYWFAGKNGTLEWEYYLSKRVENYHYYEEHHKHIESTFQKIDSTTLEVLDTWNDTDDIYDEINITHTIHKESYPFYEHMYYTSEFIMPLFLTVQIFQTAKDDKIAWANMFFDFMIYKDRDQNGILSVGNDPSYAGPPSIGSGTEWCGVVDPIAQNQYFFAESNETVFPEAYFSDPSDRSIDDVTSSIMFTPPSEVSETEISWDVEYPQFPLDIQFHDLDIPTNEWYATPQNATYTMMSPTNLSYGFDFILNETQAEFDITWGIGKISNDTAYNAVQGYGLLIPQYNFFLSSFDIDEKDQAFLSVPRDKFTFESNDTIVAEINMGKPEKRNYTLYDFPSQDVTTQIPSIGGSIHRNAIGFASRNSFYDNPYVTTLFALDDFVAQDVSFAVQDSLFSMETQNYPTWSGEKLVHDPSLAIYFKSSEGGVFSQIIPSYNLPILIGVIGVLTSYMIVRNKIKHRR